MLEIGNSGWMYLLGIIVTVFVIAGCLFFIIKSLKDAKKLNMDKNIIKKTIIEHPLNIDIRTEEDKKNGKEQVDVLLRDFSQNGIMLRASAVTTRSVGVNFTACSDIRKTLLEEFKKNNIHFAYNKSLIDGKIEFANSKPIE